MTFFHEYGDILALWRERGSNDHEKDAIFCISLEFQLKTKQSLKSVSSTQCSISITIESQTCHRQQIHKPISGNNNLELDPRNFNNVRATSCSEMASMNAWRDGNEVAMRSLSGAGNTTSRVSHIRSQVSARNMLNSKRYENKSCHSNKPLNSTSLIIVAGAIGHEVPKTNKLIIQLQIFHFTIKGSAEDVVVHFHSSRDAANKDLTHFGIQIKNRVSSWQNSFNWFAVHIFSGHI
ncbi:hypothetical protein E2C01_034834 [Portunus trituberculatus]|uniref:Uncharacterized protein n=1 Tax=Portunus trituberculatus TaxID=210409 RepID=A0A5B7F7E4_PORTR|nr:hypothetical protein [Portunus trituberculatus]